MTLPTSRKCTEITQKLLEWEQELEEHSTVCPLCWSISDASTSHRLARLEGKTPLKSP